MDAMNLLSKLDDPKYLEAQAKYENYRIAVDKAYSLASRMVLNGDSKKLVDLARSIRPFIAEDLDAGLLILEKHEATKTKSS